MATHVACVNTGVIVPIFEEKSDVTSRGSYRRVKLLEQAMKIVERVLEKQVGTMINLNKMQFGLTLRKETVDAILIMRWMQDQYQKKDKMLCMCFADMGKAFDRVPRKVME